jgi:hypothetical protein
MRKLFMILPLVGLLSFSNKNEIIGKATYYNTKPHPKVHRTHSTAAYYKGSRGQFYIITNLNNNRVDTVEITDCNGTHPGKIDLKEETFHKLTGNLKIGKIPVKITKI